MKKVLIFIGIVLLSCVAFVLCSPRQHINTCSENTFVIDKDFSEVRKILIRTDMVKRISETMGSEIVEEKWDSITVSLHKLLRPQEGTYELRGQLEIDTKSPYVHNNIFVNQVSVVTPDSVVTNIRLIKPEGVISDLKNETTFIRHGDKTLVKMKMHLKISPRMPKIPILESYIKERVKTKRDERLQDAEETVRKTINQYNGKFIFAIPLDF
jgi:hypothetical protein